MPSIVTQNISSTASQLVSSSQNAALNTAQHIENPILAKEESKKAGDRFTLTPSEDRKRSVQKDKAEPGYTPQSLKRGPQKKSSENQEEDQTSVDLTA